MSIAIIGKPNSGKSLLFNRLTGLNQKVTNFPGITVEVKQGRMDATDLFDFPGIYSFGAVTKDEVVAVDRFTQDVAGNKFKAVLCVLDATKLSASLRLGLEVQQRASQNGTPVVFALNMIDEIQDNNLQIRATDLARALNAKVIPVSARTGYGLQELQRVITGEHKRVENITEVDYYKKAVELAKEYGPQTDVLFLKQNKIDKFLLSPVFGFVSFLLIMIVLFQAIFTWSVPFMDFIEEIVGNTGNYVSGLFSSVLVQDFLRDAIFGGVGSFVVFVPQIFFLTLIVGFLEDSGYLARAAMICHKPFKWFGLSGKSFIPLLTGHACAIPAIYAARTVESPRRRFLTILAVPLMSCAARLPVYALLISAFIPPVTFLGGLLGYQGVAFFAMYAFGIVVALIISLLVSKSKVNAGEDLPFVLELPPYRLPHWKPLLRKSVQSAWSFISKAGVIIFTVSVVVWILGYFPNGAEHLDTSWLAYLGKLMEPVLEPLGLDWKYGVAILASFLAREVFVGTLGTMFGIESADENIEGLAQSIQASELGLASGVALLVIYAVALQCVSTLAVIKKELGSSKVPILLFFGYGLLAYLMAWVAYQGIMLFQ